MLDKNLILEGVGQPSLGMSGQRAMEVLTGVDAELRSLTLRNATAMSSQGGGLKLGDAAIATLTDVLIEANQAEARGGGVYLSSQSELYMYGGALSGNMVTGLGAGQWMTGGALFARSGTVVHLEGVAVEDNIANADQPATYSRGGGLAIDGGEMTLMDVNLSRNWVLGQGYSTGGAIWSKGGATLDLQRVDLRHNVAEGFNEGEGGAMYLEASVVTLENVVLAGNEASSPNTSFGAAVAQSGTTLTADFVTVYKNRANNSPAYTWIDSGGGSAAFSHTIFDGNDASTAQFSGVLPTVWNHNNVWNNTTGMWVVGAPAGTGNLAVDSSFADTAGNDPSLWDLHPGASSGLVDAGDPLVLDFDETTADIGAYGGPGAYIPGLGTW